MKYYLNDMMCLDLYLSSLEKEEYENIVKTISPSIKRNIPLSSWGIMNLFSDSIEADDLKQLEFLFTKFKWKNDLDLILKNNTYESLVLTNSNKRIVWVNKGFKAMTGYDSEFAIGKSPTFLQGDKTTKASKEKIRKKLIKNKPFKEIILNYRKDNSTYICELKIFPLHSNNTTTHFLALEKEVG